MATINKTAKIEFDGGFHNSGEITVRARLIERNGYVIAVLSDGQKAKLSRHFCGISGCTCGGVARADMTTPDGIDCVEEV